MQNRLAIFVTGMFAALLALPLAAEAAGRDLASWPFASDSPWNLSLGSQANYTPIQSQAFSPHAGASLNVTNWSHPIYVAKQSDPLVTITAPNADVLQPPLNVRVHVPRSARPDPRTDGSLHIIDPAHRSVVELWRAVRHAGGDITATAGIVNDLAGPGTFYRGTNFNWHGVRAGGMSAVGGLIRRSELADASIPHALAVAVRPQALNYYAPGGAHWVFPASWSDNPGKTNRSYATSGNLYMGSLLAIPPSVNLAGLGLSQQGLAVGKALQDYGAYIVDTGRGNIIFYAEPTTADVVAPDLVKDLGTLARYLTVVSNNTPGTVGGGGKRRRPPAPQPDAAPSGD